MTVNPLSLCVWFDSKFIRTFTQINVERHFSTSTTLDSSENSCVGKTLKSLFMTSIQEILITTETVKHWQTQRGLVPLTSALRGPSPFMWNAEFCGKIKSREPNLVPGTSATKSNWFKFVEGNLVTCPLRFLKSLRVNSMEDKSLQSK